MAAAALASLSLAGCDKALSPAPQLRGIDVTGADYGKDFLLKNPAGRERTLAQFKGKAVLMFFGFTQCPDVCPTALARAAEVRRLLGPDGDRLQVLFVSVDPERDTPQVLAEYTRSFDPTFIGLSGSALQTEAIAKEFKVYYKKVPTGASYTMDHTAHSYVFDPQGRFRLILRHDQTAQDFASDIRQLLPSQ